MSLLGSAAVAMWWDIDPDVRREFEDWHSHEHFPERMGVPGFRRGSRWSDANGGEGFFVLYELEAYDTLASPGYLARLNSPTPWSTRMMPHHQNMVRSQCVVLESRGWGVGQLMLTVRLSPRSGSEEELQRAIGEAFASIWDRPGVTGCHLLKTSTPKIAPTTEQIIRGGDAVADWALLLSGHDASALADVEAASFGAERLAGLGASGERTVGLYRLSHALSATDLAA